MVHATVDTVEYFRREQMTFGNLLIIFQAKDFFFHPFILMVIIFCRWFQGLREWWLGSIDAQMLKVPHNVFILMLQYLPNCFYSDSFYKANARGDIYQLLKMQI